MQAKFLLISIFICAVLALAVSLASYLYYTKPFTVDAEFLYRGWPLCWTEESWSGWSGPSYSHHFDFQTLNFLIDLAFYAVVFQIPVQLYSFLRGNRRPQVTR